MKRVTKVIALATAVFVGSVATAQTAEDVLRFSRYDYSFGTARSAAMGGAFNSLGADLSSMSINPAGLGMYRSSEFGISPSVTSVNMKTTNHDELGVYKYDMNKTKFSFANIGGAFNVYNGSGGMTSITLGFSYNKMIDLSTSSNVLGRSHTTRIDEFGNRLADSGRIPNPEYTYMEPGDFSFNDWGAVLAYNTMLLDYDYGNDSYYTKDLFRDNAIFNSEFQRYTKGSVGEYEIAAGFNVSNVFYFGLGFGIQSLSYTQTHNYFESPDQADQLGLNRFTYDTNMKLSGSAWNFKIGAIIRPIEALRIGVTFHTPTYIDIEERYYADMNSYFNDHTPQDWRVAYSSPDAYNMRTPARFIGGVSYTFFNTAILSVDYERVWYNNMKIFRDNWDWEDTYVTDQAKNNYRPTNNIRAGLEVILAPRIFGRVGYAFYDSMYKDSRFQNYAKFSNYSAGLGYRTATWGLDIAYVYMDSKDAPDYAFYYKNKANQEIHSGEFTAKRIRHNMTLTASFRF